METQARGWVSDLSQNGYGLLASPPLSLSQLVFVVRMDPSVTVAADFVCTAAGSMWNTAGSATMQNSFVLTHIRTYIRIVLFCIHRIRLCIAVLLHSPLGLCVGVFSMNSQPRSLVHNIVESLDL